jgi:hypothetical protein
MKPHSLCVILAQPTEDTPRHPDHRDETKQVQDETSCWTGLEDFLFSAMLQFKAHECCLPAVQVRVNEKAVHQAAYVEVD